MAVEIFYAIKQMLREDLDVLTPGSGENLTKESLMRLLPYFGLLVFVLRILFPGPFFS